MDFRSKKGRFKKLWRRHQGKHWLNKDFIFYLRISQYSKLIIYLFITVKTFTKLNLGHSDKLEIKLKTISHNDCGSRSLGNAEFWSFHVVVLQTTAKKCTNNYNARAQPLFCSLNLLFSDVPIAVVAILNSLINMWWQGCWFHLESNKVLISHNIKRFECYITTSRRFKCVIRKWATPLDILASGLGFIPWGFHFGSRPNKCWISSAAFIWKKVRYFGERF